MSIGHGGSFNEQISPVENQFPTDITIQFDYLSQNSSTEGASGSITDDLLDGFELNSDALILSSRTGIRGLTSIPSTETTELQ